jgi:hypothetical protein
MRIVYIDGKLKISLIEEEMKAIKDIANVNLEAWKDTFKEE